MKRIKHDSDRYIVPLLPEEARESLKRSSTVLSKKIYNRNQIKEEIRRRLDNIPIEDV